MDERFEELTERLVAIGRPADHFSCSEFHELYDGIKKLEAENNQLQKTSSNSDYATAVKKMINSEVDCVQTKNGAYVRLDGVIDCLNRALRDFA